jgi:predicted transglutaminase-like cysteine proteinase
LLLKRRKLMDLGYPQQALLITVVALPDGDGHAVLTVRTERGEYVLDNLTGDILPWSETGYRFVKRQSQTNPNVWVTLGNESQKAVAAAK